MVTRMRWWIVLGALVLLAAPYVWARGAMGAPAASAPTGAGRGAPLAAAPLCPPAWQLVYPPNPATRANSLQAVAAVSRSDVWAVGSYELPSQVGQTLIQHWDDSTWSVVPSPNLGTGSNALLGVAVVSSSD